MHSAKESRQNYDLYGNKRHGSIWEAHNPSIHRHEYKARRDTCSIGPLRHWTDTNARTATVYQIQDNKRQVN